MANDLIDRTPALRKLFFFSKKIPPVTRRVILSSLVTGIGLAAVFVTYLRFTPLPSRVMFDPSEITGPDHTSLGHLIADGVAREIVPLANVPIYLQEATIAVEDANFYSHNGINLKGILRALVANVEAGHIVQGGSTITQQLAKNLFLTNDRTIWRKIRETMYALQLEWRFSKSQILSDYLNSIYYGDGATGAGTASEYFFGKPVSHLDLAESSLLAGLPKGPSLYSPLQHYHAAKERQRAVLEAMVKAGYLSKSAAHAAFLEPLHFAHHQVVGSSAPYFLDAVESAATQAFPLKKEDLYRGGFVVHTALQQKLQQALNHSIETRLASYPELQVSAIVMDPKTGDILAYAGGRDYRSSPFDRAQAKRQPGSTFKPFVFAAALDHGLTPALHILSAPKLVHYDRNKVYTVHNFADQYALHPISMKQAIAHSDNVYAVSAEMLTGIDQVIREAELFGLPHNMAPYPSLALGVFPVSVLDLARAYAVFASGGYLLKPRFFSTITDKEGHALYQNPEEKILAISPATSFQMTDMLKSVMKPGGTGFRIARSLPDGVAAKTGTTDTDAWMVGYTPDRVCAVWVGYDRPRPVDGVESHLPSFIFADVMKTKISDHHLSSAYIPGELVKRTIDPATGQLATSQCPERETDYFVEGSEPTATCSSHPDHAASTGDHLHQLFHSLTHWWQKIFS